MFLELYIDVVYVHQCEQKSKLICECGGRQSKLADWAKRNWSLQVSLDLSSPLQKRWKEDDDDDEDDVDTANVTLTGYRTLPVRPTVHQLLVLSPCCFAASTAHKRK